MTTDSTDGGTVLGGDRREPASRAQHEIPREDDRSYRAGRVDAQDTGKPAPEAAPAPPVPPGGVVRVPLAARGDASISLVALGSLALLGSADDVDDALCSMVVDAASGRVGEPVDVVLVGFGEEMHGLDGVVAVADEEEALRLARSATPPAGHTRAATVFFVGVRRHAGALRELVGLAVPVHAHPGPPAEGPVPALEGVDGARARSVVVAGELVEARWRLDLHAASLEEGLVRQLGRTVPPAARDEEELPNAPTTPSIEVSVLGPVRVAGAAVPLERRPKLTELVVYLAMHPEGATSDAWATALWPDRRMPMSTLSNRVSETRLALGQAPDGFAHLRKCGTRYHLGPFVSTDWDRFQALKAGDDPAGWREALALVRGRPFEGLREAQWTLLEGAVPAIESAVVELACRLAEHLLRARDPEGAEWAARRAMLACPWDERLYRLVMRAADAAGNRAGVEAALRQLACVLELGEEPLGAVHPETATLYRSLTSRRAVL